MVDIGGDSSTWVDIGRDEHRLISSYVEFRALVELSYVELSRAGHRKAVLPFPAENQLQLASSKFKYPQLFEPNAGTAVRGRKFKLQFTVVECS